MIESGRGERGTKLKRKQWCSIDMIIYSSEILPDNDHVKLSEWKYISPSKNGVLARLACDWPYASSYCHSFFSLLDLGPESEAK